ncbi:FUSC family protein [Legionella sp. CNM-4043-24]|uniref:FUSC family protein n=1 Tax=Legionella sp. CNM-4043-24 TaxID=3421646 RepID=UPI00403AC0F3
MLLLPKTLENRAALRTALAAITAILIAFALHTDKPYWAGMTVVVVANLYTGSIIDKAIMRVLGTIIGAWFGFFIAKYIANSFLLYFLISFFLVAIAVYYYNFSQYAYAWLLGAIGGFIVIAELAIDPSQSFWVAVWRPIEICLGVVVSAAFAFCVFPNRIEDSVVKEVNSIFKAIDALLLKLQALLVNGDTSVLPAMTKDNLQLKKSVRKAQDMVGFMRHEVAYNRDIMERHRFLLDSCYNASRAIGYFLSSNTVAAIGAPDNRLPLASCLTLIRQDFADVKALFYRESLTAPASRSGVALADFDEQLAQLRDLSVSEQQNSLLVAHFLRQMTALLCHLRNRLMTGIKPAPIRQAISAQQQLRMDPDVIIHSIKAGLAAILALAFWLLSNWPGGLNGIVSSIVISIRKNLYEMHNISAFRLLGCILGGGVAFVTLFFFPLNLYLFLLVIFLSVWAFSLFSFKQVNYAYIGLQANFALVIAMAQAGGPPLTMVPAMERLGGVVIGIVSSFLVANVFWRTNMVTLLRRQMNALRKRLLSNLRYTLATDKQAWPFYDLITAFWVCRGLLEAMTARKKQIQGLKDEHETMVVLHVTMNNILESVDQPRARKTGESLGIAVSSLENRVTALLDGHSGLGLRQDLHEALSVLMLTEDLRPQDRENCAAYLYALDQLVQHLLLGSEDSGFMPYKNAH